MIEGRVCVGDESVSGRGLQRVGVGTCPGSCPIEGDHKTNQVILDCLTFLVALSNIPFDAIFGRLILALKTCMAEDSLYL